MKGWYRGCSTDVRGVTEGPNYQLMVGSNGASYILCDTDRSVNFLIEIDLCLLCNSYSEELLKC